MLKLLQTQQVQKRYLLIDSSLEGLYNMSMEKNKNLNWIDFKEDICFITGKIMGKNDLARFTYEFDAWISKEGQEEVEKLATFSPEGATRLDEAGIIYAEWYAQDAAADANDNNNQFRKNHK